MPKCPPMLDTQRWSTHKSRSCARSTEKTTAYDMRLEVPGLLCDSISAGLK